MPTSNHISEEELARAIAEAEPSRRREPHAVNVQYLQDHDAFVLKMLAGGVVRFESSQVRELAGSTPEQRARVELAPSGGSVSWPDLDVDIDVTGLVMDLVAGEGWQTSFRAMLMRELAGAKSDAKAKAARENGKRGGRPSKKTPRLRPPGQLVDQSLIDYSRL